MSATNPETELETFLLLGRNRDGGWGYHPGKASRLEPTCWALLALGDKLNDRAVIERWPLKDGLLRERQDGDVNYAFNGLGLITMRALGFEVSPRVSGILQSLQMVKGEKLKPSTVNVQDNSLQGWSWIPNTFSWVEPTAWCLLALKKWARTPGGSVDRSRIEIAERLLQDRCCQAGGWNYGNANMLGQQLKPFAPTTAVALMSLQDRLPLPEVQRSIEVLEGIATEERSGASLALSYMALTIFGRMGSSSVLEALRGQVPTTVALGNCMGAAMALYALKHKERHAALVL